MGKAGEAGDGTMTRGIVRLCAAALVLTAIELAACSGSSSSIITSGNPPPSGSEAVGDRASRVAFISACASAYGYANDAAKLRASYIAYESRQGAAGAQLAAIERDYDSTYQDIQSLGNRKPSHCSAKDGTQVKAELLRYQSGYFEYKAAPAEDPNEWKKTRDSLNCQARC